LIALDTNVLVYADTPLDPRGGHNRATALIDQLATGGHIIPIQVLGEFLNVCRNKKVLDLRLASRRVDTYAQVFEAPATSLEDLTEAAHLSARFTLQYFDALIIAEATRAGATMLMSEDMHDGLVVDALTIVNPFVAGNDQVIAAALG
jgi:predicted nucleic acid-binding protein